MTSNKILEMLEMQDSINSQIHPDWRSLKREWYRAIWIECAELMDKIGYKWWKKQEMDVDQAKMELVDIWHFILSWHLQCGSVPNHPSYAKPIDMDGGVLSLIELIAQHALFKRLFYTYDYFLRVMRHPDINMSIDELYTLYAGKYTLNSFRQDHGFQDGTYRKIWADGREDNVHLTEIIAARADSEDFLADVYCDLSERYLGGE